MPSPQRAKTEQPNRSTHPAMLIRAVASRRPTSASAALATLLGRAKDLHAEGIGPKLPVDRCLTALAPILKFVAAEPTLHGEVALSQEMCGAVLRIAEELQGLTPLAPKLREPLSIEPPRSARHGDTVRTGALLLEAYRDAVRRGLRGKNQPGIKAEFGLGNELTLTDGQKVAEGIARFLLAASQHPDVIAAAGLQPAQLLGLAAQERVLRALEADIRSQATASESQYRRRVLHLAIEYFLDRFQAALHLHLHSKSSRLREGLALLPSQPAPVTPRSGLTTCQVTESGRLIFA